MAAVIDAKDIVNRFGDNAVHDGLSLTLERGEILGVIGRSGSGKSVLLRTLIGLNRPAEGKVQVEGEDIYAIDDEKRKEMQRHWGVLFQDGALFSGLNVLENIMLPLREHTKLPKDQIEDLALFKLKAVGLEASAASKRPADLSGGMMRRAGLARALALDPSILFLDEPTAGLDPVVAAAFDQLVLDLRRRLDLSVYIITHDLDTLVTICDRVAMIVDKKLICGTLKEMMASEVPAVKEFFHGPRMRALQESQASAKAG